MYRLFVLILLLLVIGNASAQIRLVEVDPSTESVSIKNFGASTINISNYRLCARIVYTGNLSTLSVESGNLDLEAGATVVVTSSIALNDVSSDLGLYSTPSFADPNAMVDFTQWGAGGLGRESVAVTKGIWDAGDFIEGDAPFTYVGDGTENGVTFWQAAPNTETDILTYSFPQETVATTIDGSNHSVDIEIEFGTDVTSLVANFTLSEGANAQVSSTDQESGVTANDFTNPVTYTVTAEDGTTIQDWIVTVTVALNSEADILSYSFAEQTDPATIGDGTVNIEVAMGTDLTSLIATFTLSENASAAITAIPQVSGVTLNNFSNPVTYTVTAEDGTEKDWIVTVTEDQPPNTETDILTFSFVEQTGPATINTIDHTIDIEVNPGTDPSALIATFSLSEGAMAEVGSNPQQSGVTVNDFTDPVIYEVTAEDGTTMQNWTVTVTVVLNTETDILTFSIPDQLEEAVKNTVNHTVNIEVNSQIDVTDLVATFTLSTGATAEVSLVPQISGNTSNDFTNPVTYRITAEDGASTQDWTVTVTVVLNTETDFVSFSVPGQTNGVLDPANHTINIEVEAGTDLTTLAATFELSFGASVEVNSTTQTSGTTANDFTNPLTYTVTGEDGVTTQDWTITVIFDPQTDFLDFSFPEETGSAVINTVEHTILIEVEYGTDLTNLIASFTLSDGATTMISTVAQESGVTANDFTNLISYTVISSGGTNTQDWVVTVTVSLSNETDFLTFGLPEQTGISAIDANNHRIDIEVSFGTDLTNLIATFTISEGAFISVNSVSQESGITANDFSSPITYLLTAENGSITQEWVVTVVIAPNTETKILSFSFAEQTIPADIDAVENMITVEVGFGTDVTNLVASFELSPGATVTLSGVIQQSAVTSNDFSTPLVYIVTAEDGVSSQDWTVTVTVAPNTETDFLSYSYTEETEPAIINTNNHLIDIQVTFATDLSSLVATFSLSSGASATVNSLTQVSGVTVNDFSTPLIYTVTAEDGITIQDWSICVTIAPNTDSDFLAFSFSEQSSFAAIDNPIGQIAIEVNSEADITDLVANFALSAGATAEVNGIVQESGITSNDYSSPLIFHVTAEDGTTSRDWTITVSQQEVTAVRTVQKDEFNLFPNPVKDRLQLIIENEFIGPVNIIIRDVQGKELLLKQYQKSDLTFQEILDIKSFIGPFLVVEIRYDKFRISRRIAKGL